MSTNTASNLGILGNFLYWIKQDGSVMRADKVIGADSVVLAKLDSEVMDLQVFAQERQNCKFSNIKILKLHQDLT